MITFFIIAMAASVVGSICGIGGGVIIKPVMDMLDMGTVSQVSFMSSCTVLAMTLYNSARNFVSGDSLIDAGKSLPLGIGAAAGGISGSTLFSLFKGKEIAAGIIQSCLLTVLLLATAIYYIRRNNIKTKNVDGIMPSLAIGLGLGCVSSFLGIGGGPFNLAVLHYFYGMGTKKAAENSLLIILISQIANITRTIAFANVPDVEALPLVLMICGGIGGGMAGKVIKKKIDEKTTDMLFYILLAVIMCISASNAVKYVNLI